MKQFFLYAALAAVLVCFTVYAPLTNLSHAARVLMHLETLSEQDASTSQDFSHALNELKQFVVFDESLSPEQTEVIIDKIAYFETLTEKVSPEDLELTRKNFKNKIYNCLTVKRQILARNLTVCNDTILNNLVVSGTLDINGTFDICGVPACSIAQGYALLLTATSGDIPDTLVLRDGGSFAATTITLTGVLALQGTNGNTVNLQACPATPAYTVQLPCTTGNAGNVLAIGTQADGTNFLTWQPVMGIITGTIQLYGDVTGSSTANTVSKVCGIPACNIVQTYSTVLSATSANICGTLVLRDSNCNFSANTITANLTGTAQYATNAGSADFAFTSSLAQYANTAGFALTSSSALTALTSTSAQYASATGFAFTSSLAQYANTAGFALTSSSALSALTSVSSTYFTGQLYGDVVGTQTATHIVTVCGVPACNLINSYSQVLSGTSADIPLTLVLRDSTGSFVATTITLTGNSLINYSTLGGCNTGTGFIWAPKNNNTLVGIGANNSNPLAGSNNTAFGYNTLSSNIQASDNTALGYNAISLTTTSRLTAVGSGALQNNTTGIQNVAVGYQALNTLSTGTSNTAVGYRALAKSTTDYNNVAVGYNTLMMDTVGSDNTAVGNNALTNSTVGQITAVGSGALQQNTTGIQNVAVGYQALNANTTGGSNTALGYQALKNVVAQSNNIAVGFNTLSGSSISGDNIAIGVNALSSASNTVGQQIAIGSNALQNNTGGVQNVAIGYNTLMGNQAGYYNTVVGNNALTSITNGQGNTGLGYYAFGGTSSGNYNTGIGVAALNGSNSSTNNTAVGYYAIGKGFGTSSNNAALGYYALLDNLTGSNNTALGSQALNNNTTGVGNIAVGYQAFLNNQTGQNNTCLGYYTLGAGATNLQNTVAVGYYALAYATGFYNTALGYYAIGGFGSGAGTLNTAVGYYSLYNNAAGSYNTALGYYSLEANTTGTGNVAVGYLALTNANGANNYNNIAIGANVLNAAGVQNDNIALGANTLSNPSYTGSRQVAIGSGALQNATSGLQNVAIGYQALNNDTTDSNNIAIGYQALKNNTSGSTITAIGTQAMANATSTGGNPAGNTAVGAYALGFASTIGAGNTALGYYALGDGASVGTANTAVGYHVLYVNTNYYNTAVGYQALQSSITGTGNVALGYNSGSASSGINNFNNIYIGSGVTGSANDNGIIQIGIQGTQQQTFIAGIYGNSQPTGSPVVVLPSGQLGVSTGSSSTVTGTSCDTPLSLVMRDTTGSFAATTITLTGNSLINYGTSACSNGSGFIWAPTSQNTLMGLGIVNNTGTANSAFGAEALLGSSGSGNTAVGAQALTANTTGSNNIGVGVRTLFTNQTGQYNTALGTGADVTGTNAQYRTALGAGASAVVDNGIVLGDSSQVNTVYPGQNKAVDLGYLDSVASNTRIWATIHTATQRFYDSGNLHASFSTPAHLNNSYDMLLPINQGIAGQVFSTNGANPAQLSWITTITNSTQLNWVYTATSCDITNSLVLRDSTGSFAATTITLTGNSLINYSPSGDCADMQGFVFAPKNFNTLIGLHTGGNNILTGTGNVALGYSALASVTSGYENVALGFESLSSTYAGFGNVAIGSGALAKAIDVDGSGLQFNVAVGYQTLTNMIAGGAGEGSSTINTALGSFALNSLVSGDQNVAVGYQALSELMDGGYNTAVGAYAMQNATSPYNVAVGDSALSSDTSHAGNNTAVGQGAMSSAIPANGYDVAVGVSALIADEGGYNTALGAQALSYSPTFTGIQNVAIGYNAGLQAQGSNNIYIGANVIGASTDNGVIKIGIQDIQTSAFIAGIYGTTVGVNMPVLINSTGQLGTVLSSKRYKDNIQDMGTITESLNKLRPVIFNYKTDENKHREYGLIAEEVQEIYPDIVIKNADGLPETVQYQYLPMMMLNEFQKDHREILELKKEIAELKDKIDQLLQK